MPYLQRLKVRPSLDDLTVKEANFIKGNFDVYAGEVLVYQQAIPWTAIDEIEVAKAARAAGPAGWLVKRFLTGEDSYHVGIYFSTVEAVLPNVSLNTARHIVQSIAFYVPHPVQYKGPEGLSPLVTRS